MQATKSEAEKVIINDVGPRDGLQNQAQILSVEQRQQLINTLVGAGLPAIEVGSFVSPKAVPAMAGTGLLVADLPKNNCHYTALIPNAKGYQLAKEAGVKSMGLVLAASNTMNEKNIRMTTAEALSECKKIIEQSKADGIEITAYVATAWGCHFEGEISQSAVIEYTSELLNAGAAQVIVADTIGSANPATVTELMTQMVNEFGAQRLACHFHDTRGMGLTNVYAALQTGIRHFDASIGGLGGCPFSPGASGNVATEDVVLMLEQMGYDTGIDLKKLVAASELAKELTGNCQGGHGLSWLQRQRDTGLL